MDIVRQGRNVLDIHIMGVIDGNFLTIWHICDFKSCTQLLCDSRADRVDITMKRSCITCIFALKDHASAVVDKIF